MGKLALGSVPMTLIALLLLYHLGVDSKATQGVITKVLGVALLFTALSLFMRKQLMALYDRHIGEMAPGTVTTLTILTGGILGLLVTISSVGAGAIGVTALVLLYPKMPAQRIVGSDIAHAVPLTLLAGIGHSVLGTINFHLLISLLCGSLPAIVIASMISAKVPEKVVRIALGAVLLLVCARFWFLG